MTLPDSYYLNAMDPGGTTGMSLLKITPEKVELKEGLTEEYDLDAEKNPLLVLKNWQREYRDLPHVLVYEAFHIRPGQKIPDTTAIKVIESVQQWLVEPPPDYLNGRNGSLATSISRLYEWISTQPNAYVGMSQDVVGLKSVIKLVGVQDEKPETFCPFVHVEAQEPVQAKRLATDQVLVRLGMKFHGKNSQHINDSLRHAVTWLTLNRHKPLCERAWPKAA